MTSLQSNRVEIQAMKHIIERPITLKYIEQICSQMAIYYYAEIQIKEKTKYKKMLVVIKVDNNCKHLGFVNIPTDRKIQIQHFEKQFEKKVQFQNINNCATDSTKLVIGYLNHSIQHTFKIKFNSRDILEEWKYLMKQLRVNKDRRQRKTSLNTLKDVFLKEDTKKEGMEASVKSTQDGYKQLSQASKYQQSADHSRTIQRYLNRIHQLQMTLEIERSTRQPYLQFELENKKIKNRSSILESERQNLQMEIIVLKETIQNYERHKNNQNFQNIALELKVEELTERLQAKQLDLRKIIQENRQLRNSIQLLKGELGSLNENISNLKVQYQILKQKLNNSVQDKKVPQIVQRRINQQKKRQLQFEEYKQSNDLLKKQNNLKLQQFHGKIQKMAKEKQQLQFQYNKIKRKHEVSQFFHIFEGYILQNHHHFKSFLKDQIEKFTKKTIIKTKIIYQYNPQNKANFHSYIDGKSDIVLIVKTQSGAYFAGFSESPVSSLTEATDRGLIISLTNSKVFRCCENKKSVGYDSYYIIFGNSEIRIKSLEKKVFSNFGIGNGFYASNGLKADVLLGMSSEREVQLEHYEVHQIMY